MRVLGIETSCDETGVAIYDSEEGLVAHALHSQVLLHQRFGGVVPELASRDHIKYLTPLVKEVLVKAKMEAKDLDGVAYTAGPGLIGALLTGATYAKSFALALDRPQIRIHHLEAHILAALLDNKDVQFPFLALLVSGGHTQLIAAEALGSYRLLGDTLDDAVGEAFDKTAKLMGIPYPGGAFLSQLADNCAPDLHTLFPPFPKPMTNRPGFDFSFSGLKTHALTLWSGSKQDDKVRSAIAFSFQKAVIETLLIKSTRALAATGYKQLVVAGGVSANKLLRKRFAETLAPMAITPFFPRPEYCTDNGAMVAFAGFLYLKAGLFDKTLAIEVKARWPLNEA